MLQKNKIMYLKIELDCSYLLFNNTINSHICSFVSTLETNQQDLTIEDCDVCDYFSIINENEQKYLFENVLLALKDIQIIVFEERQTNKLDQGAYNLVATYSLKLEDIYYQSQTQENDNNQFSINFRLIKGTHKYLFLMKEFISDIIWSDYLAKYVIFLDQPSNYKIKSMLGKGSNAQVYKVQKKQNKQPKAYDKSCQSRQSKHPKSILGSEGLSPFGQIKSQKLKNLGFFTQNNIIIKEDDNQNISKHEFDEEQKIDKGQKKIFALKQINKFQFLKNNENFELIQNEIKVQRKVGLCGNVLKLHEIYETENNIYLVLDYQDGGSLFDILAGKQKIIEKDIQIIMAQLFLAVDYLHQMNIIHRDLKLDNILLNSQEQQNFDLRIADFGLAQQLLDGEKCTIKCGTPTYIAPEILEGKEYDTRSDIFGLGSIMYNLFTGRFLFESRKNNDILYLNKQCDLSHIDSYISGISIQGQDLLRKILQKNPETRISARQALQHKWFSADREALDAALCISDFQIIPIKRNVIITTQMMKIQNSPANLLSCKKSKFEQDSQQLMGENSRKSLNPNRQQHYDFTMLMSQYNKNLPNLNKTRAHSPNSCFYDLLQCNRQFGQRNYKIQTGAYNGQDFSIKMDYLTSQQQQYSNKNDKISCMFSEKQNQHLNKYKSRSSKMRKGEQEVSIQNMADRESQYECMNQSSNLKQVLENDVVLDFKKISQNGTPILIKSFLEVDEQQTSNNKTNIGGLQKQLQNRQNFPSKLYKNQYALLQKQSKNQYLEPPQQSFLNQNCTKQEQYQQKEGEIIVTESDEKHGLSSFEQSRVINTNSIKQAQSKLSQINITQRNRVFL
eukprot:403353516